MHPRLQHFRFLAGGKLHLRLLCVVVGRWLLGGCQLLRVVKRKREQCSSTLVGSVNAEWMMRKSECFLDEWLANIRLLVTCEWLLGVRMAGSVDGRRVDEQLDNEVMLLGVPLVEMR